MAKTCDNASVGVILTDDAGGVLLLTRATPPVGIAPAAGHVFDEHTVLVNGRVDVTASYRAAAVAEVREELGLTLAVETLMLVAEGWRTAACRRAPGPGGPGHHWRVYRGRATGTLAPSARETHGARYYSPAQLQELAARTVRYAWDGVPAPAWEADPGLEPVWVRWLHAAGLIEVTDDDLWQIDQMLAERARRGVTDGRTTVEIVFRPVDGEPQTLWGEVDDLDHLDRLQEVVRDPDRAEEVISLRARLTPDGPDYPRGFRAGATTLTEVERPLPDADAPAHPDARVVLPLSCRTCGGPLRDRDRDGRPASPYCSTRCTSQEIREAHTARHPN